MKKNSVIMIMLTVFMLSIVFPEITTSDPPPWAPAHGYRRHSGYVYFPERNIYYDLKRNGYFFFNGGNWQFGIELPLLYSNFDLVKARKIVFRNNWDKPYIYNDIHVRKYGGKYKERENNDDDRYWKKNKGHYGKHKND